MNNLIPFQFEKTSIRVVTNDNGEPLFVGKDICEALGFARTSDAMQQHCKGAAIYRPLQTAGGTQELRVLSEPDVLRLIVNCTLPAAAEFERLVFEEILPTIRKTGRYASKGSGVSIPTSLVQPAKEFRAMFGIARLVGMDKNSAAISASQAVQKITGQNILALLGKTHLDADNQTAMYFTPTELGDRLGISGRKFNMLLAEAGLQAKKGEHWIPLTTAEGFCRIMDTGKRHGDGTMIQQIKWAENVLALVEKAAA